MKLSGTYKGTFERKGGWGPLVSQVTLNFNGNKFSGESSIEYYPAICNGTVSINNNIASFDNACAWPANFDWRLILDREYDMYLNGDTLRLTRSDGGDIVVTIDKYELIKQH
ncbi:MAG TPA: hypothetical protein VEB42_06975 [Chitinophagaceae bacterium]|nr:hypothetical protein [Chitinophagaceae bacterium]